MSLQVHCKCSLDKPLGDTYHSRDRVLGDLLSNKAAKTDNSLQNIVILGGGLEEEVGCWGRVLDQSWTLAAGSGLMVPRDKGAAAGA